MLTPNVRSGDSERDIIRGRKVALGLIAALVGSQMMEGKRDVETGITIDEKAWDDAADDECSWD